MSNIIQLSHLKKYYQASDKQLGLVGSIKSLITPDNQITVKAVDDISFQIGQGELVGFIGPNGAGKTTTLKCLSGLLHPTSGKVSVLGFDPKKRNHQFLKQISFIMGQKNQLWWNLPPIETFNLNKAVYEISDDVYKKQLNQLIDLLEAEKLVNKQTRKLSLGERMKCELIASLLHQPKVLFLDEPTIGLDVVMQKKIRDFIKYYNRKYQSTIILTSHYMQDVKELAKKLIIIDKGKLAFKGKLSEINQKYSQHKLISVTLRSKIKREKLEAVASLANYQFPKAVFRVDKQKVPAITAQILNQFEVDDLNIEQLPIDSIIRQLFTNKNYV